MISILPDNAAVITLDGKQMLTWDHYELTFSLVHDALSGCLDKQYLQEHMKEKAIAQYTLPAKFEELSENLNKNFLSGDTALELSQFI